MQVVNINHVAYNIPLSWDELTYSQAIKIVKHIDNKAAQLSAISGIDLDIIDALPDTHASQLFHLIAFTEDLTPFESTDVEEKYKDFDFGSVSFGLAEKVRQSATGGKNGFEVAIDIIKILNGEDISERPFLEVIGSANFFLCNTLIFIITMPNLTKIHSAMNKKPREWSDSIVLEVLQRTLKSQGRGV